MQVALNPAGAEMVLVQSEGIITDGGPGQWRADVVARFVEEVGSEKLMFEAASPEVFAWCVRQTLHLSGALDLKTRGFHLPP